MDLYLSILKKVFTGWTVRIVFTLFFLMANHSQALSADEMLGERVSALERYVAAIEPMISELTESMNAGLEDYTKDLESGLENYARTLQVDLDQRLDRIARRTVVLNPYSREYQNIETGTGLFLIAVDKVEPIEGGLRLHLNVGNPNYADYSDFKIKIFWGEAWTGQDVQSYDQWRRSLNGAEYEFRGKIQKGKWNAMSIDLSPVKTGRLGYLECEMSVASVELGIN